MAWNLLLAHYLGDFVFQTDWMVRNRDKLWVLSLHGSIHFVWMFILAGQLRATTWPFLLLIALAHISQDKVKNDLTNRRPDLIGKAFIVDQVMHYAVIWAVTWWIQGSRGPLSTPDKPMWVIVTITYLLATYVWFISERLFNLSDPDYLKNINNTKFSRMLIRAGLVSLFVLIQSWSAAGLAMIFSNPYPDSKFRQRALLTDVGVSFLAMIFLYWALR